MGATIITTEDLREFKMELLDDIKQLLANQSGHSSIKWLKSPRVRDLLGISSGTLQNLRINDKLPYTNKIKQEIVNELKELKPTDLEQMGYNDNKTYFYYIRVCNEWKIIFHFS